MRYILALDEGTTSARAILFDEKGAARSTASRPIEMRYPQEGWVEQDVEQIWQAQLEAAREALATAKARATDVAAIGITNQRETTILWERATGKPVAPAIVWQDRRTAERCRELQLLGHQEMIRELTGLVLDPYFSATKLERLLGDRERRRRAEQGELAFGTIDSWLIARLTGGAVHATDHTNASRTMLYGLESRAWEPELLKLFGVPAELLPRISLSSEVLGETIPSLFGQSLPIAGVAGDQQAALFGQGCVRAGMAKNTYGTGAFLLTHAGESRPNSASGLLVTAACGPRGEPQYALEGSVFIAGAAIQWLRDGLGLIQKAAETEVMARSVPDTGGVHFVPAFVGLGSPHWEAEARGTITGLTRGTTRAHLVRAALEAMAFSSAELIGAMLADAKISLSALRVDGGASTNDWLMQFQADLLGFPVERPDLVETTALGAAGLAGLALGLWPDVETFVGERVFRRFEPTMGEPTRQLHLAGWQRAMRVALGWARGG